LKTKGGSKSTTSWILTTILPPDYRSAEIIPPSIIGSPDEEAAYMGICSVIVSLIALSSGGELPDHKLMNYLERFNSGKNTGLDTTAATLQRMIKHGYIYKSTEKSADDETVHWRVGARGKVEIGNKGVQGLVRQVYGDSAPDDLDKRMQRSLGMEVRKVPRENDGGGGEEEEAVEEPANGDPGPSTARRASGRRRRE
jgi:melanoma-associated antigen